jgi:hypothetical protein
MAPNYIVPTVAPYVTLVPLTHQDEQLEKNKQEKRRLREIVQPIVSFVPEKFIVTIPKTEIRNDQIKDYVVYDIHFHFGKYEHVSTKRYRELNAIHNELTESMKHVQLPPFPGKTLLATITQEFIDKRTVLLINYFNNLLKVAEVLVNNRFHESFNIPLSSAQYLISAGDERIANRISQHNLSQTVVDKEDNGELQITDPEIRREMYAASQTFHRRSAQHVWYSHDGRSNPVVHSYPPTLIFTAPVVLTLKENYWRGGGDSTITGPDLEVWFRVKQLESHFNEKLQDVAPRASKQQFSLENNAGEPLVFFRDGGKGLTNKIRIYRMLSPAKPGESAPMMKLCSIERLSGVITPTFHFKLHTAVPAAVTSTSFNNEIECIGSWRDFHTTFRLKGNDRPSGILSRIDRSASLISRGIFTVTINPQVDVLLYLSLAVAVDKLHCEAY